MLHPRLLFQEWPFCFAILTNLQTLMNPLTVSLIQSYLHWEDKEKNLQHFETKIASLPAATQVVVLPEMFTTGFSMKPEQVAESMDGATVAWMKEQAGKHRKIIAGSIVAEEQGQYYNRLIWMLPNGVSYHYDKRHLFAYAGEDKYYTVGEKRLIVQVNGWKICLQICYDLRFPVWARQKISEGREAEYDMLIYVANWPARRSHPWKTLLQARAIENQCYVVGVNRIGDDGNGVYHSGDSMVVDPLGNPVWQQADEEAIYTHTFQPDDLRDVRTHFPFLQDADNFLIL
jgi:predicted amidohydrolase